MPIRLACFLLLFYATAHAQQFPDKKAALHIVGEGFVSGTPQSSYPFSAICEQCNVDTSLTRIGDTVGIHLHNEFLLFRSAIAFKNGSERLKFVKPGYVTIAEFGEFQQYIRDSSARERIYQGIEEDEVAVRYIQFDKKRIVTPERGAPRPVDISERDENRRLFPLNRDMRFSYEDPELIPLLADMYLPLAERINHVRAFDDRKLIYHYVETFEQFRTYSTNELRRINPNLASGRNPELVRYGISALDDHYTWAQRSTNIRDAFGTLGELYRELEKNSPVVGLTGMQAAAFCHWKQEQLQHAFDAKGFACVVIVTLPTPEDQQALHVPDPLFTIPERDYTEQWRITAGDYKAFVAHVRDSLLREYLYEYLPLDDDAAKLLQYNGSYFSESGLEMVEYDVANRDINRYLFPLNFNAPVRMRSAETRQLVEAFNTNASQAPAYDYWYTDAWLRSVPGEFVVAKPREGDAHPVRLELSYAGCGQNWEPFGKDMGPDYGYNTLGHSFGVRAHENLQRFNTHVRTPVLPDAAFPLEKQTDESAVQGISYEQALAYYHWKYPIRKSRAGQSWQDFVLPAEEQFFRVQNGERLVVPTRKVAYPSPLFRYVVHLYPVR